MKIFLCALLLVIASLASAKEETIDVKAAINTIRECYKGDVDGFSKCLLDFWIEVKPLLTNGIPELGIPKADPLFLAEIEAAETLSLVQGKGKVQNVTVRGIASHIPKNIIVNAENRSLTVELEIPKLDIDGEYEVDGVALLLPVKGHGTFHINVTGVAGKGVLFLARDGPNNVKFVKTDIDFTVQNASGHMNDLLGGDEVGEAINKMLNDNAQDILNDVKPTALAQVEGRLIGFLESAIKLLPADAFVLPEGVTLPAGVDLPLVTQPTTKSSS